MNMTNAERKLWRALRARGIGPNHVLRFWNNDVLSNIDGVLTLIAESHPSPGAPLCGAPPSPSRGEGSRARGQHDR